ncbi:biosynthetic peptidoglycan transglycosylase [uncultured Clostridium sp.]|uniref:biosynthetic peptidoglycan transglycosylase n=1 Tax=Clostridium TaxID=1485 RepID=UPI0025FE80A5|nr:biosynthetic peptidoglycan transglycosylase [uncultured Clostridium sp.]MDU2289453.1 biosynthetic peptidoglycan transglycosylase [Clostridium celatum]MDU4326301.1 biosynthetic peptidoglycan transglycosylase [Clostridium celatum]
MSKNVKFKLIKIIIALTIIIFFSFMLITSYIHKSVVADVEIESIINEIQSNSNYVQAKDINRTFLNAIVAIEDHRFYEHGAIDLISIARATLINIKNKEILEGGSTITQQLVKNVFLDMNQTFERKINEIFLAFELEKLYSKEEILELYVNVVYYGDGYTGIKAACNGYFNKQPKDLTEDEATLLAGLPQAPSLYALNNNYERALDRQQEVIEAYNRWGVAY